MLEHLDVALALAQGARRIADGEADGEAEPEHLALGLREGARDIKDLLEEKPVFDADKGVGRPVGDAGQAGGSPGGAHRSCERG